jgi:hypothetical protein
MRIHTSISKAVELLEMIEYILISKESEVSAYGRIGEGTSNPSVSLPLSGMKHSISESIMLLRNCMESSEPLYQNDSSVNKVHGEDEETALRQRKSVPEESLQLPEENTGGRIKKTRNEGISSGLAGRIRPVPEEVRGRVRELVDMIESEEFAG